MGITGGGTILHDTLDVNSFLYDKTCVCVCVSTPHQQDLCDPAGRK